jgi:hypothetical protein
MISWCCKELVTLVHVPPSPLLVLPAVGSAAKDGSLIELGSDGEEEDPDLKRVM